jgi:ribonucleotide reductase beta subunit family protein with ferritin-like domain
LLYFFYKCLKKVFDNISYPLESFTGKSTGKKLYRALNQKSREIFQKWKNFKGIRSKIEDFNKILKQTLSLRRIHHYTEEPLSKKIYLNVLLAGLITTSGFKTKKILKLSEMLKNLNPEINPENISSF